MPVELARGRDGSSYTIECSFEDEDGNALAPTAITWSLLNPERQIVNSRDSVSVASPASTVNITLNAADMNNDDGRYRYFVLEWEYNSSYGSGLTGREQATIHIDDIEEQSV